MAFNFIGSFQKNKRFWMAAILLVCIFTFVFCTGGVDSDRLLKMIVRPRGTYIATVGGRSISETDLGELKTHRKLADAFMRASADHAIRRLSADIFSLQNKAEDEKNAEARQIQLGQFALARDSLVTRRAKSHYFEIADKFDDLLEFKMWQAVADRLNIRLEDEHVEAMYFQEFFGKIERSREVPDAQRQAMNLAGAREISNAAFFRAIREEFRVRIAKYAVAEGQTFSFLSRADRKGAAPKFVDPELPDEIRAPMTLAQIHDAYKKYRSEFNVSLLPVPVEAFLAKANEPSEIEKNTFFANNKSRPIDPNSPDWGLVPPPQIRFEYVYADPKSPVYVAASKTVTNLTLLSPAQINPLQSPLLTAIQLAANEKMAVRNLMMENAAAIVKYVGAPLYSSAPGLPVTFYYASQNPEAVANLVLSCGALTNGGTGTLEALAGFMAWGLEPDPDRKSEAVARHHKNDDAIKAALDTDAERRKRIYGRFVALNFAQSPYLLLAHAFLEADQSNPIDDSPFLYPLMPIPDIARDVKDAEAKKLAESWAQSNMIQVRRALDSGRGDIDKIRRELNRLVPALNLTHGPVGDAKYTYYNRHTIKDAKDLEYLKTTFARYTEVVNQFENLDAASGTRINPGEFHRMFFDSAKYSASTKDVVVAWPPKVVADNKRIHMRQDPRRAAQVSKEVMNMFHQYVNRHDPNLPIPELDLYAQSPDQVLYWRTAELPTVALSKYADIDNEIAKVAKEKTALEAELQKQKDTFKAEEIRDKIAAAKQTRIDLQTIKDRVDLGYRLGQAKANSALPKVTEIAKKLATSDTFNEINLMSKVLSAEVKSLLLPGPNDKLSDVERKKRTADAEGKSTVIDVAGISIMNPERLGRVVDYTSAKWAKEQLANVREDLIANLSQLPDLQKPFVTGNKQLDTLNKELFDEVTKRDKGKRVFVQVIPNIAQDVYYLAAVSTDPNAQIQKNIFGRRPSLAGAFSGSFFGLRQRDPQFDDPREPLDLLLDRLQERHAREYRQQLVRGIREVVGFELTKEGEEFRKKFDERTGD